MASMPLSVEVTQPSCATSAIRADTRRDDLGLRAVAQLHTDLGRVHALTRRALQVAAADPPDEFYRDCH